MVFAGSVRGAGCQVRRLLLPSRRLRARPLLRAVAGYQWFAAKAHALAPLCTRQFILAFRASSALEFPAGCIRSLLPGNWVVASTVRYRDRAIATDSKWTQELSKRLPGAVLADIVGSDTMVPTPAEKSHLFRTTGAVAVDMESHIAAEIAAAHQIPFAACRVIIDAAHRALPVRGRAGIGLERFGECFCGDAVHHAEARPASRPRSRCARCLHRRARLEKRPKAAGARICVAICQRTRRRTRFRGAGRRIERFSPAADLRNPVIG